MRGITWNILAATLCTLALTACKSDDGDDDGAPAGRGSAVCNEWQGALCDRVARCGATAASVETCRGQASSVTCASDETAASCVSALEETACAASPGACDLADLADPAPAGAACLQFVDAVCQSYERCGEGTKAECLARPSIMDLCAGAIGYSLSFDECREDLGSHPCEMDDLPPSCDGAILRKR